MEPLLEVAGPPFGGGGARFGVVEPLLGGCSHFWGVLELLLGGMEPLLG